LLNISIFCISLCTFSLYDTSQMDEIDRLKEAEFLIKQYFEVSKIRDEAERIRQFVKVDSAIKEYYKNVLQPLVGQHLRLAFSEQSGEKAGLTLLTHHEISPRPEQEKAIIDFAMRLDEALAYTAPLAESSKDDDGS
jgi:hypothetical protein